MKSSGLLIVIVAIILGGCASEPPPTSTPKPTKTAMPLGTFKGCTFYEDELIKGDFTFYDENDEKVTDRIALDCIELKLIPGFYMLKVASYSAPVCSDGCYPEEDYISFEIADDEIIEMDFDLFLLEN